MTTSTPEASRSQAPPPRIPSGVRAAADYIDLARAAMPAPTFAYLDGGSGAETTLHANLAAFGQHALLPRIARDLRGGHTRMRQLGEASEHPILLAPVAHQRLAHPNAELETARAAAATDTTLVVSTLSSQPLEAIAAAGRGQAQWFQLYLQARREDSRDLLERAEAAGYRAIVLTLDATLQLPSHRALRSGFAMPAGFVPANLAAYPQHEPGTARPGLLRGALQHAPLAEDVAWVVAHTRLPVIVKGVLHPDDAVLMRSLGAAGVIVSNHGGRTFDGVPASLAMLPAVRAAVGEGFPLLLDSGIRSGLDVFRALALGADAVLVGRLQVFALAVAGALGVAHMLRLMREELEAAMATAGCATLADITPAALCTLSGARPLSALPGAAPLCALPHADPLCAPLHTNHPHPLEPSC